MKPAIIEIFSDERSRQYDMESNLRKKCQLRRLELASEFSGVAFVQQHDRKRTLSQASCKTKAIEAVMASDKGTDALNATNGKDLRGKLNKVVLAYSGGLDTSVIVPWLRENYGCEVVCFTADVGQGISELEGLEAKAKASGACQLVVKDLTEEFVKDYVYPCLRAGAVYERKYLLGTSMARPVIAKAMVDVAKEVGADAVAHGCTGKGNDQASYKIMITCLLVRFELTFFSLNPDLQVVAPWREWDITGREDAIEYAKKHNIPVPVTKKSIYSRDRNLWHISHEGDIMEDPANEPKKDMYMMSVDPEDAPNKPEYLEIGIVSGIPVSINGKELCPASLLSELNDIGGRHGIGRIDMVENRLVGMKSRGVYETPGGTILAAACRELESLTLDREAIQFKDTMALKYAELVYAGRWFDPLRESMDAFMEHITKTTTGSVMLKLYKGSVIVASRKSPYSLYREDISSFESGHIYDQADAAGFIKLYGLPMRVRAMLEKEQGKKSIFFIDS
ncbi:argininosuccinate synthase, chloroplastic [Tanacetum coccineum]